MCVCDSVTLRNAIFVSPEPNHRYAKGCVQLCLQRKHYSMFNKIKKGKKPDKLKEQWEAK